MASAQVLPNSVASSRKQGHLEAGKKKLEEFRKKKAEGRAKKAASTGQLISADVDRFEKFSQNHEHVRDGATSGCDINPSGLVMAHESKAVYSSQSTDIGSSNETHATSPVLVDSDRASYGDSVQNAGKEVPKLYESSGFSNLVNGYNDQWKGNGELSHQMESKIEPSDGIATDRLNAFNPVNTNPNTDMNINHLSFHSFVKAQSGEDRNSSKVHMSHPETSGANLVSTSEKSERVSGQNRLGLPSSPANTYGLYEESAPVVGLYHPGSMNHDIAMDSDMGRRKIADSINQHLNVDSAHWHAPEPSSKDSSLAFKSSQYQHPFPSTGYGTSSGRSRPSFLDSLSVSRVSISHVPYGEAEKANPPVSFNYSKIQSTEIPSSSSPEQPFVELNTADLSFKSSIPDFISDKESFMNSSVSSNGGKQLKQGGGDHHAQRDYELFTLKKDEDFAALEQHIEDLTREKFSLQRALDTSRTLAVSLAAENSSLTDSYNHQGKIVNQLKSDMERLQEEIKAQLLSLESVNLEYANAQLECNAADERAKILASEVIGLEEKALRLRSNELKLEKQLENLNSEIISYKRKVSILEKERQDFQSTIDALHEEKKLLQSKLRKASTNGKVNDEKKTSTRRDVSSSTEDLVVEHLNLVDGGTSVADILLNSTINPLQDSTTSMVLSTDASNFSLLPEDRRFNFSDASGDIPHVQLRMIDNINSLISELVLEKEELIRALKIESSNCSKLKDLSKDLSQKLEAQTQRLELLTAQRMANENVLAKPIDTHSMQDTTEYADEGDEVVERVLGWIMKLFPGGPAKRRTSKLL